MKILVLGDPNSTFVRQFVNNMHNKLIDCTLEVLAPSRTINTIQEPQVFKTIYPKHSVSPLLSIPKVRGLIRLINLKKTIQTLGKYDICHIHFVYAIYPFIVS